MVVCHVTTPCGEAESILGKTSSICMAILFGRSLCPTEKIISELSFQSPFHWNFPAPTNFTPLFTTAPCTESQACCRGPARRRSAGAWFLIRQASPDAVTQLLGQTVHTNFISWPYDAKS